MGNDQERQDATISPQPVSVDLTSGLEGARSTCCYAPAVQDADESPFFQCSKCGYYCDILTDDQKKEINIKALDAIKKMVNTKVVVIVLHKPTNRTSSTRVGINNVRQCAERAISQFPGNPPVEEFVIIEVIGDRQVRVSTLK